MAEGGMVTALVDYSLDYWSVLIKYFYSLFFFFLPYSKSAQPLVPTNQASLLTKCRIVIPKETEQSIIESEKRVNKYE